MATKAKLTLSQFLFRRTSSSSNSNSSSSNSSASNNQNSSSINQNHFQSHSNSNNVSSSNNNNVNIANNSNNLLEVGKYEQFADFQEQLQLVNKVYPPKKVQANFATVSAASGIRHGLYEIQNQHENLHKISNETNSNSTQQQQHHHQLHGILKRGGKNDGIGDNNFRSAAAGGKTTRSSLHRSRSNPNPMNNPLKEVSWSCPTLEKRREVILNYFERIILENKQEQNGNLQNRPNIPCEGGNDSGQSGGEPIYEEISDCPSSSNMFGNHPNSGERTGSLKPKVMPKKVRMNIPQDQEAKNDSGNSPIYDKVLCRSHSMIEPSTSSSLASSYYSPGGSGGYYDILPSNTSSSSETHSFYENFAPYSSTSMSSSSASSAGSDYVNDIIGGGCGMSGRNNNITTTRIAGRSQSFHDNYRATSHTGSYNIQCGGSGSGSGSFVDTDQMYAKVCKRKKTKGDNNDTPQLSYIDHRQDDKGTFSVQVSCGNGVTTIPVMMPCSSSFSTSCLSLSSSSDNNTDDMSTATMTTSTTTIRRNNEQDNDSNNGLTHYYSSEKILPDKDIAYVNSSPDSKRNRNNLSVIHLLASYDPAKEIEEFIPTTPGPTGSSFTAIIDSTGSAPKSISVPVRAVSFNNSKVVTNDNNYVSGGGGGGGELVIGREDDHDQPPVPVPGAPSRYLYSPTISSMHRHQLQEHLNSKPLMVTNCSYGYDVDDYEEGDNHKDHEGGKLSSTSCSSGSSCTDGEADDDDEDEDDDDETKYTFPDGVVGGVTLLKKITFQDDPKELILLTSDSEDEEICEHKSLIDMNSTRDIMEDSGLVTNEKYIGLMDDEDREFDSFLDDNEEGSASPGSKGENPSFSPDNLREQRTFSQGLQNVPQEALKKKAASVLDLINSEISDLHMRELELKKLHGSSPIPPSTEKSDKLIRNDGEEFYGEEGFSGEDDFSDSAIEYDGFTTNGSHSSGQISPSDNLNEMGSSPSRLRPDEPEQVPETITERKLSPASDENGFEEGEDDPPQRNEPRHKVRPLEEEEVRTITFSANDETPIEREIRLIREREEEFQKLNSLKKTSPSPTPALKTASLPPVTKTKPVLSRPNRQDLPSLPHSVAANGIKDAQYEMATARFKREIAESMQREKELISEGRLKKGVTTPSEEDTNEIAVQKEPPSPEVNEKVEEEPESPKTSAVPEEPKEQPVPLGPENVLRKPTLVKLPINKLPAARFFAPSAYNGNKPRGVAPVVSPIRGGGGSLAYPSSGGRSSVGGSLPIGINKPSFTSMEKYMMQYMQHKTAAAPTITEEVPKLVPEAPAKQPQPQLPIAEDPLRIVQKPTEEDDEVEEEKEIEEKPKRRYVPAQDKIHREIQELAMREKELTYARAKWKSTPDLQESMTDPVLEETSKSTLSLLEQSSKPKDVLSPTAAAVADEPNSGNGNSHADEELDLKRVTEDVREVTRVKAPPRRRHSVLINQWEERIRQQQQINNKK